MNIRFLSLSYYLLINTRLMFNLVFLIINDKPMEGQNMPVSSRHWPLGINYG